MTTLQEQFNAIKNGKGNKVQFLKQARSLFPQYLNQYSDFNTSVNVLKSKQIINEAVGGVVTKGFNITNWKQIFEAEAKAEEKTTSKEAADANKSAYQPSNVKNADNINFNEILKGYLAELGDVKNAGKTGDELKEIAVKNLAKDPLFYTKNGEFSSKGVGYTTEAPGLGTPKEPKGKFKASGYGDIDAKTEKVKANVKNSLGDKEAKTSMPSKVKEMPVASQNASGVKKMPTPGAEKKIKLKEGIQDRADAINDFAKLVKTGTNDEIANTFEANRDYPETSNIKVSEMVKILKKYGKHDDVMALIDNEFIDPAGGSGLSSHMEEQKLRSIIRNIINEELIKESIKIDGKTVKTYTQNGDTSYNVTYDDGTKDIIYVNNDGWDEINQLHRNAIGDDAYRKQFNKI